LKRESHCIKSNELHDVRKDKDPLIFSLKEIYWSQISIFPLNRKETSIPRFSVLSKKVDTTYSSGNQRCKFKSLFK
jgi:hypothetical protein